MEPPKIIPNASSSHELFLGVWIAVALLFLPRLLVGDTTAYYYCCSREVARRGLE